MRLLALLTIAVACQAQTNRIVWDSVKVLEGQKLFHLLHGQYMTLDTALPSIPDARPVGIFKPLSLKNTQAVFGKSRNLGIWNVGVCADTPVAISRVRVMMAAPQLTDIPNALAQDELQRQAGSDPRSLIGNNGDTFLTLGGAAATAIGVAKNTSTASYVGLGFFAMQIVFQLLKHAAPNPAPYLQNLLPDEIVIDEPRGCRWGYIVTPLVHNAHTIGPVPIQ